jgi:hypothetical protein
MSEDYDVIIVRCASASTSSSGLRSRLEELAWMVA